MRAQVGHWLIVHGHTPGHPDRRGQILGVGPAGAPPFTVRWTDDDRQSLVFPGPDAEILTAESLFPSSADGARHA